MSKHLARFLSPLLVAAAVTVGAGGTRETVESWCSVDDHSRPLPGEPPAGWFYNDCGGDRGMLAVAGYGGFGQYSMATQGHAYVATLGPITGNWSYLGMWYAIGHPQAGAVALAPSGIFRDVIRPEYQPVLTGVKVRVTALASPGGRSDLFLALKLKRREVTGANIDVAQQTWEGREALTAGTFPKEFVMDIDPGTTPAFSYVEWLLDRALPDDTVTVDGVWLRLRLPRLTAQQDAVLLCLGMLLEAYSPATGMVNDRTNFPDGVMENVTATAKLAKLLALAKVPGLVDAAKADAAILKIADTLLHKVPHGPGTANALLPHFTRQGGTQAMPPDPTTGGDGSEWASGDSIYALQDLLLALKLIGDPDELIPEVLAHIRQINWAALILANGGISHGYSYDGTLIPHAWLGCGMETLGVLWGYHIGTGNRGPMGTWPTDNGSGFIMVTPYPVVPRGTDLWHNRWPHLIGQEADTQIQWYAQDAHRNVFFRDNTLFGLSAGERPTGWDSDMKAVYAAFGIGGTYASPLYQDQGADVIVGHYCGLLAPYRLAAATAMWQKLRDLGLMSSINNLESMSAVRATGQAAQVNRLKGSWNMALQAEGWLLSVPAVDQALWAAARAIPEFAAAYDAYFTLQVKFAAGVHGSLRSGAQTGQAALSFTVAVDAAVPAVTAWPDAGYRFDRWTRADGSEFSGANPLAVTEAGESMDLTAQFVAVEDDGDGDGLPDAWEAEHLGKTCFGATDDPDADGDDNITEYVLGTDPMGYELKLATGWNLVALGRLPADPTVAAVLAPAGSKVLHTVWAWETRLNTLVTVTRFEALRGYWIYAAETCAVPVSLP